MNAEIGEDWLIQATQAAIQAKMLGYHRHYAEPQLAYSDGSLCPLGAALPEAVVRRIERDGWVRFDWLELMRAGYFGLRTLREVEALTTLQLGYDMCFDADAELQSYRRETFEAYVLSLDAAFPPAVWPSQEFSMLMFER